MPYTGRQDSGCMTPPADCSMVKSPIGEIQRTIHSIASLLYNNGSVRRIQNLRSSLLPSLSSGDAVRMQRRVVVTMRWTGQVRKKLGPSSTTQRRVMVKGVRVRNAWSLTSLGTSERKPGMIGNVNSNGSRKICKT
jgi:hypothetical protein